MLVSFGTTSGMNFCFIFRCPTGMVLFSGQSFEMFNDRCFSHLKRARSLWAFRNASEIVFFWLPPRLPIVENTSASGISAPHTRHFSFSRMCPFYYDKASDVNFMPLHHPRRTRARQHLYRVLRQPILRRRRRNILHRPPRLLPQNRAHIHYVPNPQPQVRFPLP